MNKQEALTRLSSLEHEAKELRRIIEEADKPKPVTERIKTFMDACKELGENPYADKFNKGSKDTNAFEKLKVIIKALNEGWIPDWSNYNQYKYYPFFEYKNKSFVFYHVDCYSHYAGFASALYLKNKELANYAGTQFINEYNEYLLNK